jgi:autophagy-related protein 33
MASKGVSILKFVGTVSLGLLTGFSYTLTTLAIPTLLSLPSASSAAKAFTALSTKATTNFRILSTISSSAFFLAFLLSPRSYRHPYLLYTSVLVAASGLAEQLAPYVTSSSDDASAAVQARRQHLQARRRAAAAASVARSRAMEASYDIVGDAHSEGGSATGSASGEDIDDEHVNGEVVHGEVEGYMKTSIVQTAIASVGFLMAVVGIWGDGVSQVYASETIVYI